jgi:hypothetical protein
LFATILRLRLKIYFVFRTVAQWQLVRHLAVIGELT